MRRSTTSQNRRKNRTIWFIPVVICNLNAKEAHYNFQKRPVKTREESFNMRSQSKVTEISCYLRFDEYGAEPGRNVLLAGLFMLPMRHGKLNKKFIT